MSVLAAELSDLAAWSEQTRRAGSDCGGLSDYVTVNVPDGDFGMILELITGDYESLIPVFTEALATDGQRLGDTGDALSRIVTDYAATDARVAQDFGVGARLTDDGLVASGFYDVPGVLPVTAPSIDGQTLPVVSFGAIFDKICDLTSWIIGIDPREYVTRWIAGDIEKASLQASAWQHVSDCLDRVEGNLERGQSTINGTWSGHAATASSAYVERWLAALTEQASGMGQISRHLRDMIRSAVDLAQSVVDLIRMIISMCSAALASSYIPLWGQWKAVKTIKEAWEIFKTARKAIQAFWLILTTIKDLLIGMVHAFGIESLPSAPAVPAGP